MEKVKINFSLEKKEMTAQEFINFCKKLILNLKSFDNIFENINVIDIENKSDYFFSDDLSDFTFGNLYPILNDKDIAYKNENPNDINLNVNSKSWAGFSILIFAGVQKGIHAIPDIVINISQGSYDEKGTATLGIEYSEKNRSKLNREYVVKLIELIINTANVTFANIITGSFFLKIRKRGKKSIGWINYFSDKRVSALLPDNVDKKQLQNGGCIFWLSEGKPLSTDENMVQKAIKIRETLDANNIL